jgi:hypothetical protein
MPLHTSFCSLYGLNPNISPRSSFCTPFASEGVTFAQIQFVRGKTAQYPSHPKAERLTARCFAPRARALGLSHRAAIHPGFGRARHCHGEISRLTKV